MTYTRSLVLHPDGAHSASIVCLSFSPTGTHLATGDNAGTIIIWSVETGEKLSALTDGLQVETSIAVSSLHWDMSRLRSLFIGRVAGVGEVLRDALNVRRS